MLTLDQGGAVIGSRRLLLPPHDLLPFVELISIDRRTQPPRPAESAWRVVPDASGHLLYHALDPALDAALDAALDHALGSALGPAVERTLLHAADRSGEPRSSRRLLAVGARSRPVDLDVRHRWLTAAVRVRPGALPRLVGAGGAELVDRGIELDTLQGRWIGPLADRLHAAADLAAAEPGLSGTAERALYDALVDLTRALLGRRRTRSAIHGNPLSAATAAIAGGRAASVADLAHALGTSPRGLHQRVRRELGFGPKRWLTIHRLHRAFDLALYGRHRGWADVAAAAGFADQSHLIRSSRELLGETPGAYLTRGQASAARWPKRPIEIAGPESPATDRAPAQRTSR